MAKHELYVIADNIRSLYNVGALFRLCDGVGINTLYLCETTGAPFERIKYQRQRQQIAKTALEGLHGVKWEYSESTKKTIEALKKNGVKILALEQSNNSTVYTNYNYPSKLAIVLGNEVEGVSPNILNLCDDTIELPMNGRGKSLNVISAASAALYHIKWKVSDK